MRYRPSTAYLDLGAPEGAPFYDQISPARFPEHIIRFRNERWAQAVGLGGLSDEEWTDRFGRFEPLEGGMPAPIAIRYHGHQFRVYNPDIGDGRGFLYAQLFDDNGRLLDFGTKGSGQTPYSRSGDGRLTLKGGVREVLASSMLEALGVYTSKTFSLIETGEALDRNDEPSPTRSAVMVRLSHSHLRFGIFQRLAYERDEAAIERLAEYCIANFYPEITVDGRAARAAALFERTVAETARLAGSWMAAGFVHGVLNTDNLNMTGESFDYGPWRFAPTADPSFTAAYFDHGGLYSFGRQAEACAWALAQLGGALSLVSGVDPLNSVLETYWDIYKSEVAIAFSRRLGVEELPYEEIAALLSSMASTNAGFEQTLFDWRGGSAGRDKALGGPQGALYQSTEFAPALEVLAGAAPSASANLDHAYFQGDTPLNLLIEEVEGIWAPIAQNDDWGPFEATLTRIEDVRAAYGRDEARPQI